MSHSEDELMLHIGETDFLMTRGNAVLFTFFGRLATRNHVFLITGEEDEGVTTGSYIFAHATAYNALVSFMAEYEYPARLNSLDVPQCDEDAFQRSLEQIGGEEIEDFIPDDWT
jgi:hypothetical protein